MNEKRNAYVQKLKAQLDEWNADINKLDAKSDLAEAGAKTESVLSAANDAGS
ncbi:MAG: hypothetical protein WB853_09540 [Desulfobacterales bacterium]